MVEFFFNYISKLEITDPHTEFPYFINQTKKEGEIREF